MCHNEEFKSFCPAPGSKLIKALGEWISGALAVKSFSLKILPIVSSDRLCILIDSFCVVSLTRNDYI